MMKPLQPIENKPGYYELIEADLNEFWMNLFYKPLVTILNKPKREVLNNVNYIRDALLSGKIQYTDNEFSGKFNSSLVKQFKKMGATFDKRKGTWKIAPEDLPVSVKQTIAVSQMKIQGTHKAIVDYLDGLSDVEINRRLDLLNLDKDYKLITSNLETQFQKSVKKITIETNYTKDMIDNISQDYSNNMKLYIKGWSEENIIKLREQVKENFDKGYRLDNLIDMIQSNYNVSLSKAKFLAKQETSLLTAKYREQRYKSAGVNRYRWKIKGYHTRPDHRALEGKEFTWDNPPITDKRTGARNNPGEDFNCNCTAIALVDW